MVQRKRRPNNTQPMWQNNTAKQTKQKVYSMKRPTRPPHDGTVNNKRTFAAARQNLVNTGLKSLSTAGGTPFTAEAHAPKRGKHRGEDCIKIKGKGNKGEYSVYIYSCCWGHVTNCSRTYIDVFTPIL